MLAVARERARAEGVAVEFLVADAQRHAFPPRRFEAIVSRFGVMFFDDPVAAFANLRTAAADGAGLRLIVWRPAEENPFMTTAERAVAPLLPRLPQRDPNGPGQFGLADRERAAAILSAAGWADVELTPLDVVCSFPEAALLPYLSRFGPVGCALRETDPARHPQVLAAAREAFAPFVHGDEVRFTAACWTVTARA
jgi:SAM-dependent methyltransferase